MHRCTSILVRWYYSYYAQTQAPGPGPSPETPYCALTSSALSHYHHHRISLLPRTSSPMLSPRSSRAAYFLSLSSSLSHFLISTIFFKLPQDYY